MAVKVISSLQDDLNYFNNLAFLQRELNEESIQFQGPVHTHESNFPFQSGRTYDFVRSAGAKIREAMTKHLTSILDGIDENAQGSLRQAFGKLFNYYTYKGCLKMEGRTRGESMRFFIFKPDNYVAHVNFSCTTMKGAEDEYTVHTNITCQKFTPFEPQYQDMKAILEAIQNLHVTDQ